MAIGKKRRFEIFKRDSFTCRYCGAKAPDVFLELDHVIAKSKGGSDDSANIVTSCLKCNRGKSNISLDKPAEIAQFEIEKEKFEQEKKMFEFIEAKNEFWSKKVDHIHRLFKVHTNIKDDDFTEPELGSIKYFLMRLGKTELEESVFIVVDKQLKETSNENEMSVDSLKRYFFGVLTNKLGKKNG